MVKTESVLIKVTINAMEGCDIAIADVQGEFLSTELDEEVYIIQTDL